MESDLWGGEPAVGFLLVEQKKRKGLPHDVP